MHLRDVKEINELIIPQEELKLLTSYALDGYPKEICGLFLGDIENNKSIVKEYFPITNVSPSETKWDYVPDPNEYMKILSQTSLFRPKSYKELACIFHTHPRGIGVPSIFDVKGASWHTVYLIYGMSDKTFRAWFWNGRGFYLIPINDQLPDTLITRVLKDEASNNVLEWNPWENMIK
jgi:proteasome lid subunit RPN8/RPN11